MASTFIARQCSVARGNRKLAGRGKPRMGSSATGPPAMDDDIPLRKERLLFYSFLLKAIGIGRGVYTDESCTDTLVRVAALVGTLEGRPYGAGQIADYVKVPRETVRRRLAAMAKRGDIEMCGSKARVPKALLRDPAKLAAIKVSLEAHRALCRALAQIEHKGPSKPI